MFQSLLDSLRQRVSQVLGHARMRTNEEQKAIMDEMMLQKGALQRQAKTAGGAQGARPVFNESDVTTWGNPGRNDKCPCGSGKKFKHCHGKL